MRTGRPPALDVPADEVREVDELSAYGFGVLLVVGERRDRAKVGLGAKGRGGGGGERERVIFVCLSLVVSKSNETGFLEKFALLAGSSSSLSFNLIFCFENQSNNKFLIF